MKSRRILLIVLTGGLLAALAVSSVLILKGQKPAALPKTGFLSASGKNIIDPEGQTVVLKGVNIGNWFVQEFWMGPVEASSGTACQKELEETLERRFGADQAGKLLDAYLDHYFTEKDFDFLQSLGFNCLRLPLWYGVFTDEKGTFKDDAFKRVDWFVEEAGKRGMTVILDMHGAYGSQNGSDHSGIDGRDDKMAASEFFFGPSAGENQERFLVLWEEIAKHYRDHPAVAGYDLLNEPFCTYRYNSVLSDGELHALLFPVYDAAYQRIRAVDPNHMIFMEAVWDAKDLPDPGKYGWENVVYEYHNYEYSNYQNENNAQIKSMKKKIRGIKSANYQVPSLMGEFNYFNNMDAWKEGLKLLNENGISWCMWSYKCMTENDNWGLMRLSVPKVHPETDSYGEILEKWSGTDKASENTPLIEAVKTALSDNRPEKSAGQASDTRIFFDTSVTITLYGEEAEAALSECFSLCRDMELVYSAENPGSELYRINHREETASLEGKDSASCTLSDALSEAVRLGLQACSDTGGLFDITLYPVTSLWDFRSGKGSVPDEERLKDALLLVDSGQLELSGNVLTLSGSGTKIDLGAVAKGCISKALKAAMKDRPGVDGGVINLGGNISVFGSKPDNSDWLVGIQKPFSGRGELIAAVSLKDGCVISSGVYERNFTEDGTLYHHILSAETGMPVYSGLSQATVIGTDDALADTLSTVCMLLGKDASEKLILEKGFAIRVLYTSDDGTLTLFDPSEGETSVKEGARLDF